MDRPSRPRNISALAGILRGGIEAASVREYMLLEIEEDMVAQEVFLFLERQGGHFAELSEVGPAVVIEAFRGEVAAGGQQGADGDVHEVLFLFLGVGRLCGARLLQADEEEDGFHVGLFAESGHESFFKAPPPGLEVVVCVHGAKVG